MHRIYGMPFARVYPLYVTKLARKGRTQTELDEAIEWLTGYSPAEVQAHIAAETSNQEFFDGARLNPAAGLITGVICGVRVENIEEPTMQRIRYLDKLVDELYYGKAMEKVLRS
ncbi:MAG: DUF2200 domain-containing protein [Microbacteriaceae bacterium]|nr:DUF2200 domain-containing protein [Microbacteriaceae bacterium]